MFPRARPTSAIEDFDLAIQINPKDSLAFNNRGLAYRNKGETDSAINNYDQAILISADFALAYYNRGNAYYDKRDYDRAIQDYNQALKINPNYALAYYDRGVVYYDRHDYEKAVADLSKAIELDPKDSLAYYNRGLTYRAMGEMTSRWPISTSRSSSIRRTRCRTTTAASPSRDKGDLDRAVADFSQSIRHGRAQRARVLQSRPGLLGPPRVRQGARRLRAGDPHQSGLCAGLLQPRPRLFRAARLRPRHPRSEPGDQRPAELSAGVQHPRPGLYRQGRDRPRHPGLRPGDPARCRSSPWPTTTAARPISASATSTARIADFDQAIKANPNYDAAYYNRGSRYRDKRDFERAAADFGQAIKLDPKNAAAYNNRGFAYWNKGDNDDAIADFEQAIKLDPEVRGRLRQPRHRLLRQARLRPRHRRLRSGDQAQSEQRAAPITIAASPIATRATATAPSRDFDQAIKLDPQVRGGLRQPRPRLSATSSDYNRAIADLDNAIRLDGKFAGAYNDRGLVNAATGKTDRAHRRLSPRRSGSIRTTTSPTTTAG